MKISLFIVMGMFAKEGCLKVKLATALKKNL